MSAASFQKDIKPIFAKYVQDMQNIPLASASGTRTLHLGDYESVKFFYYEIQVAIHGYDYATRDGKRLWPDAPPLLKDGKPVTFAPHPMPLQPDDWPEEWVRLPQEAIDTFDAWVAAGMPA